MLTIFGLIVGVVIVSQVRPLALWCLDLGARLPVISRFANGLRKLYDSTYELLRFKNLVIGVGLGLISWSSEGVAFFLVLVGLGVPASFELVLLAIFILALSSILGGASTLPGGLGAAEATMAGALVVLVGLSQEVAATATLLIRFFTLWFGVGLGILTVVIWRKMLFGAGDAAEQRSVRPEDGAEFEEGDLIYEQSG